jgi:hypothetical protein
MEGEIQQRRFFVVQVKCPSLMIKRTCYVGHGYRVLDVEFRKIPRIQDEIHQRWHTVVYYY